MALESEQPSRTRLARRCDRRTALLDGAAIAVRNRGAGLRVLFGGIASLLLACSSSAPEHERVPAAPARPAEPTLPSFGTGAPPPSVCAAFSFFAGGSHHVMGCPPNPEPVLAPRPCRLDRSGDPPVPLRFDASGRLVRADDLTLEYDAQRRLARTQRPWLDGRLEARFSYPAEDAVHVAIGDAAWDFELDDGLVRRLQITSRVTDFSGDQYERPVADWTFVREPGRIEAEDRVTGSRAVTTFDVDGRILRHVVTPANDPEIDDDLETPTVVVFGWEGDRWSSFTENGARSDVRYGCD